MNMAGLAVALCFEVLMLVGTPLEPFPRAPALLASWNKEEFISGGGWEWLNGLNMGHRTFRLESCVKPKVKVDLFFNKSLTLLF